MSKRTARLVYVATPYAGLRCHELSRHVVAVNLAKDECKKVRDAGYIPVSPILMWNGIYDEKIHRNMLLKAGLELMSVCSYAYFSHHPDSEFSEGMKKEKEYAMEIGLSVLDFDCGQLERALF